MSNSNSGSTLAGRNEAANSPVLHVRDIPDASLHTSRVRKMDGVRRLVVRGTRGRVDVIIAALYDDAARPRPHRGGGHGI